jgi:hypothetical protein
MRRETVVGVGFWLLVAAFVSMFALRAHAQGEDEAWQAFHGQVLVSDVMIAPTEAFDSGATLVAALRRVERKAVDARDGFWRLHLVAFLDPAAPSRALRMRATDITAPQHRVQVRLFDVDGEPGQKMLSMKDLVLSGDMGFKPGHQYELAIEQGGDEAPEAKPAAGKPDVYAKGMITLR